MLQQNSSSTMKHDLIFFILFFCVLESIENSSPNNFTQLKCDTFIFIGTLLKKTGIGRIEMWFSGKWRWEIAVSASKFSSHGNVNACNVHDVPKRTEDIFMLCINFYPTVEILSAVRPKYSTLSTEIPITLRSIRRNWAQHQQHHHPYYAAASAAAATAASEDFCLQCVPPFNEP